MFTNNSAIEISPVRRYGSRQKKGFRFPIQYSIRESSLAADRNAKKIVWGAGTPRTLRAHWSMHELGLDYERRPIGSPKRA